MRRMSVGWGFGARCPRAVPGGLLGPRRGGTIWQMRNFQVQVRWDGQVVAGVTAITPLRSTVEVVTLRDGASGAVYKLPGRADTAAVTLQRGVSDDLAFDVWASGPPLRKDVEVRLFDPSDELSVLYRLHQCWVGEYVVAPDVETGLVMESISLSVNRWERVRPPVAILAEALAVDRAGVVHRVNLGSLLTGTSRQTWRHLDEVLAEAEAAGAVLLLDEADALFTQRTQVPDSDARYEPSELDALLDRLSVFPGLVLVVPPGED